MAEIDSLEVKIQAEASNANSALTTLIKKFDSLSASLSKLNGSGMQEFSKGMSELTASMQGMKNVNASVFTKTAKGLQKFENIDSTKLSQISNSIQPLARNMSIMSNTKFDNTNLTNFVNALTRLSNSNVQSLNTMNFSRLGMSIANLSNVLSSAQTVPRTTTALVSALAKLGATGGTIGMVAQELPALSTQLKKFTNSMAGTQKVASETIQFTTAVGQLASAGAKTNTTAKNLAYLAEELKKFFAVMAQAPQVSQNTIQLVSALGNLQNGTTRINLGNMNGGFKSLLPQLGKANSGFKSLAYTFGKFYANCWLLIRGLRMLGKAINLSSQLTEVQNVVDVSFGKYAYKMNEFANTAMTSFGITELSAKQAGGRFQAMANSMGLVNAQAREVNSWLEKQNLGYEQLGDTVADMSINLVKLSADFASFFDMDFSEVAEDMQSVFTGTVKPLKKYGISITQASIKEWALKNGVDANISSMSQAQKTMLTYQYVMANSDKIMNDYVRTHDTWSNRIKLLKQQFQQLGTVIGGAFINAFKPALRALNTLMSAVINFAKVVSNALGKIFGWTYEDAGGSLAEDLDDASDSADGVADGVGKAADNAKKLKQQLQGFDELNVLSSNKDDDSGSGKGSGASAGGTGGQTSDVDGQWKKTKSAYDSIYDSFYKLGNYIGTTFKNNLDSIDWDSAYQKANKFGIGLAQLLNGFNASGVFASFGTTIAESLNTGLKALNSFAKTFDWYEFGSALADGVNNFFKTFDTIQLARTINNWIKGALTTATTFLNKTDFEEIGKKIGQFLSELDVTDIANKLKDTLWSAIKSAFDLLKGVFEEAPLESAIITGLAGFKLLGVGGVISSAIGKAIASTLAEKLGVELAGEMGIKAILSSKLTDMIKGINLGTVGTVSAKVGLAVGVMIISFQIGKSLYDHVPVVQEWSDSVAEWICGGDDTINVDRAITVALAGLNVALPLAVIGGQIAKSLSGITITSASLGSFGSTVVSAIGSAISSAFSAVTTFGATIMSGLSTALSSVGTFLTADVATVFAGGAASICAGIFAAIGAAIAGWKIGQWLYTQFEKQIDSVVFAVGDFFTQTIPKAFSNAKTAVVDFAINVKGNIDAKAQEAKDWLSNAGNRIANFAVNVAGSISEKAQEIKNWFADKGNAVKELTAKVADKGASTLQTMKDNWNSFKNGAKKKMTAEFQTKGKNTLDKALNIWNKLKEKAKAISITFQDNFTSKIKSAWNGLAKGINGAIDKINKIPGVNISKVPTFATGGFPEDGWFRASRGEIMGKFDNGQSVVANNMQITQGISNAVYKGNQQLLSVMQEELYQIREQNRLLQGILEKETGISSNDLFKSVRNSAREYTNRTGNPAF